MTAQIRSVLKGKFEQGDAPQGADYEDLIDSAANLAETTVQSFQGEVKGPKFFATSEVCAPSGKFTALYGASVSAATLEVNVANVSSLNITADTSVSHISRASASFFVRAIIQGSIAVWLPCYR